jgi:hypothetical protein
VFVDEFGHTLGCDNVDLKRRRKKVVTRKQEGSCDGIGSPVDGGIGLREEGLAEDTIIAL